MKDYYLTELDHLRRLAREFAAQNPAVAPFLDEQGTDPDVERLLEGTAYLCALVQQRMDAGFPELVQSLVRLTFPELLKPSPSMTLVKFASQPGIIDPLLVSKGSQLASLPVDNVSCRFSLMQDISILPVMAGGVTVEEINAHEAEVTLRCTSLAPLERWWPKSLRLYLGGDYTQASQRLYCLLHQLESITVTTGHGSTRLAPGCLKLDIGAADSPRAFKNHVPHGLLHAYYTFPHQFLFLELTNLDTVPFIANDHNLSISFRLAGDVKRLPPFPAESFQLNVAPAVNAFPHNADPIRLDHTREDYLVLPENVQAEDLAIISVESVKGIRQGGRTRAYRPYEAFRPTRGEEGVYTARQVQTASRKDPDFMLSVLHTEDSPTFEEETLSINLLCHHPNLAPRLGAGDICRPTDTSPAMATFTNVVAPSAPCPPLSDENTLWRFLSHLHVNLLSVASAESLRAMLRLNVPDETDSHTALSGQKKIEAIEEVRTWTEDRLFQGRPLRGRVVQLTIASANFASTGDMFLFGSLLERFLAGFASINTYTRLEIETDDQRVTLAWPSRLGRKQLL